MVQPEANESHETTQQLRDGHDHAASVNDYRSSDKQIPRTELNTDQLHPEAGPSHPENDVPPSGADSLRSPENPVAAASPSLPPAKSEEKARDVKMRFFQDEKGKSLPEKKWVEFLVEKL